MWCRRVRRWCCEDTHECEDVDTLTNERRVLPYYDPWIFDPAILYSVLKNYERGDLHIRALAPFFILFFGKKKDRTSYPVPMLIARDIGGGVVDDVI